MKITKIKIIIGLVVLVLIFFGSMYFGGFYFDRRDFSGGKNPTWGVSFRMSYAQFFGLDPKVVALAMFDDMRANNFRLIIPWKEVEKEEGKFDFSFYDWFIGEAEKHNAKIVLNIGERVAGWPEFHIPDWAVRLSADERKKKTLDMLSAVVNRYKNNPSIEMWQVSNEPLFDWNKLREVEHLYGISLKPDPEFLAKEIILIKSLDKRPVIITDSGELSDWRAASKAGDYFGTTLYRMIRPRVWDNFGFRLYYGYLPPFTFISPAYYHDKAVNLGLNINKVYIMELQAEPWIVNESLQEATPQLENRIFDISQFRNNVDYARRTGFPRAYFWGAEWWYYMKVKGYPEIWNEAKKLWQ